MIKWIPMMLDGDEHMQWRRQLGPLFAPGAVDKIDGYVRQRAIELIEAIADRCLGSHLARRELRIALEEWHKRIADYRIVENAEFLETGSQLGLESLPLQWDA